MTSIIKNNDCVESDIISDICTQIRDISKMLSEEPTKDLEKELCHKMYIATARIIAIVAWREGKKSPIPHFLTNNQQPDSLLKKLTIQEINSLTNNS